MKPKILVVDDVMINRGILTEILENDYEVIEADNGKTALELIEKNINDLAVVLLDLMMPVMDGYQVLDNLRSRNILEQLPVLVISGETEIESEKRCLDLGASDFIKKPFNDTIVLCRVNNIVTLYQYKNHLEEKIEEQTVELIKQNEALNEKTRQLERFNETIIDILGTVVESRNLESGDHIQRVKKYTEILARCLMVEYPEYGLTEEYVHMMVPASALHDVGKIAIPDSILLKPGRLTSEEFDEMKKHTTRGCEIIDSIIEGWNDEYKTLSYEICRHHHERYDGHGYPDGLVGENIPISAQIVSIADVYDALVSKRVYKDAYGKDTAFHMILNGECGTFSPKIIDCFIKSKELFEKVFEN